MSGDASTIDPSVGRGAPGAASPEPGLLLVVVDARPTLAAIPVGDRPVCLGRGDEADARIADGRMSRRHAEVARAGGRWIVRDLDSRNGTLVDGVPAAATPRDGCVIRVGDSLLVTRDDVRRYRGGAVERDGDVVIGPTLRAAYDAIAAAATAGTTLHITGETGSGKELAARRFHQAGAGTRAPFVAVNCAAVPPQLAERLLFGARKGAYSGADSDADGHVQAADGGTLFLDEIGELPLDVQAKLLRVLEAREVLPLGATRPRPIDVRVCSASHVDLRAAVAAGRFREDLYFRLGRPAVMLPAIRDRPDEIPWLVQRTVARAAPGLDVHVSLYEAALGRRWPGNVRELVTEIAQAARAARAAHAERVEAAHLGADAGRDLGRPHEPGRAVAELTADAVGAALRNARGNVSAAARTLGVHRTQLRRWLTRHGDPRE